MTRGWFRRRRDPDTQRLIDALWRERDDARARLAAANVRHRAAAAEWAVELRRVRRGEAAAHRALSKAFEPAPGEDCVKVRLRDRDEAVAFARHVESSTGGEWGALAGYRCKLCPRQPVSGARFWHVGNVDQEMRSGRETAERARKRSSKVRAADAHRSGRLLGQRAPVLQDLRTRMDRAGECGEAGQ